MPLPSADTIAAIASAQGRGGVGVIRVSGPELNDLIVGILGRIPDSRHASYGSFLGGSGEIIDQGIALYFPAPHSYTGEAVLELQGHGGTVVLQMLLQRCLDLGARLAEPGEFTLRAFLNGKLDLAQAESVADLIEASSAQAVRSAMRSLKGDFSGLVHGLSERLISLRMLVEAMLDFPEEEVTADDVETRDRQLAGVLLDLGRTLEAARQGSLLREGAHIVIAGQPNVGKSSLLNKLAGEELALVSSIPGTTRDVIRQSIQIRGVPLHIIDTAGLRTSEDEVERMGIALAHQTLERADLILMLLDATQGMTSKDAAIIADLPVAIPRLIVMNKGDLLQDRAPTGHGLEGAILVSAKTGAGIEALQMRLLQAVGWRDQEGGVFIARERHLRGLTKAQTHLEQARAVLGQSELFAEELRLAQSALNDITGEFTSDDLLGEIFSRFCIGK